MTSRLRLRAYIPGDLAIAWPDILAEDVRHAPPAAVVHMSQVVAFADMKATVVDPQDQVVAIGAVVREALAPRTAMLLTFVTSRARRHLRELVDVNRQVARLWYDALDLRRLHALIRCDDRRAAAYARAGGFVFECGPLREIGPRGEDFEVWRWQR